MSVFRGNLVVFEERGASRFARLLFAAVGLALLCIGLIADYNVIRQIASPSAPPLSPGAFAFGIALALAFTILPLALLYIPFLMPDRTLLLDPAQGTAVLTLQSPFGTRRKSFDLASLTPPTIDYVPGDGDSFPKYYVALKLPDGSTQRHCEVMLTLDGQKQFARSCADRISRMIAQGGAGPGDPR